MEIKLRPGDTLWYYSQLFMVPLNLILDSNPHVNPNKLAASETIQIPGFELQVHKIKQGETLWKLAGVRNISVDSILLINQHVNPNNLQVGDEIYIPNRIIGRIVQGKKKYDYHSLQVDLTRLKKIFPFIQVKSIGKSVLGHNIEEIRIGKGTKKVHINASFHANEWITTPILMVFLNDFLLSLTNGTNIHRVHTMPLYQSVDLSIVPMVNPDGVNLVLNGPPEEEKEKLFSINGGSTDFTSWKANIRGVDLNNQFPANWEIEKERKEPKSPAPRDYPGDTPLSEPEAQVMAKLAHKENFDCLIALHTQGKEFYWGYEGLEPAESQTIANEFYRVSGYKAIQNVDSHAGYKDWFIQEFRKPGFTLELGKGINPLPLSQFTEIYHDTSTIFLASLYL
ncbi:peptidase M14 [Niallia circulans]|jgi:g-D-glutamyl-meso-diaminopimelate peptidase|uniref:Peptidase M14 n=1 Tax=Niallia circulans TaxID=1397 RepID=A0A0J1IMX2_NIACI|nr:M14 family metallopeptidase [Niallia circulans]KLV27268.1 peptidase M14 [Niallia circulans]MCM2980776.1 M14 family metallopeptidase [Niallia circulans]MDR4314398.1 LysM peptidoglycan-binding domain-containing protein [Niallia circulans]MED3839482.1 M14 family metallopeptidase [Niallia circulans]MED4242554.1 M14 family metallopeptidase [Niallia circulans]